MIKYSHFLFLTINLILKFYRFIQFKINLMH